MTIKVYDSSSWNTQKKLQIFNGSSWQDAKKAWTYQGGSWQIIYPEYPVNTVAPVVSGSTTQGNTLSTTAGTWNSDSAYTPTSYSYQWTRAGSNISAATSSTYTTVSADIGNAIACKVTGTNERGGTTVTSSNSINVIAPLPGPPPSLTISNGTSVPGQPASATTTYTGGTTATFTFTAASGTFQKYWVATSDSRDIVSNQYPTSPTTVTITKGQDTGPRTLYVGVAAVNNSAILSLSWTAGTNATSYDIYINSVFIANTSSTSYNYSAGTIAWPSTTSYNVNVRSKNSTGIESTGISKTGSTGGVISTITPGQASNITW